MTSNTPPSTPAAAHQSGAAATVRLAHEKLASHWSSSVSTLTASAAASQTGDHSAPSMASGVTTSVTHGIATALASRPITETWLNSRSDSGVSAKVMIHCCLAAVAR